jgi:hypothetical protein
MLLFAIVLGLAAVAATLAPDEAPRQEAQEAEPHLRAPSPRPGDRVPGSPLEVRFGGADAPATRRVPAGVRVVATVTVESPGEVTIPELGRVAAAEPGTPATFDLFLDEPGRYEVRFTPASGGEERTIGVLVARDVSG